MLNSSSRRIQNTAHKIIHTSCFFSIAQILKSLYWLPILYRMNYKICCFTYCALLHGKPYYLRFLLTNRVSSRFLHSIFCNSLVIQCFKKVSCSFLLFFICCSFIFQVIYLILFILLFVSSLKKELKTFI